MTSTSIHPKVAVPTATSALLALLALVFHVHLSTEATAAVVTVAAGVVGYLTPVLSQLEKAALTAVSQAPAPAPPTGEV